MFFGCSKKEREIEKFEQGNIIFSHSSGHYYNEFLLDLKPKNGEGEIYYTLDGTLPEKGRANTLKYASQIEIKSFLVDSNDLSFIPTTVIPDEPNYETWIPPKEGMVKGVVLRAMRLLPNQIKSEVVTRTYIIDKLMPNLPELYLTIDSNSFFDLDTGIYVPGVNYVEGKYYTGNYFQRGKEWERRAHMEYLSLNQKIKIDQDIGVRINGMASPKAPLKTLRLSAKKKYGKGSFKFSPFELTNLNKFKRLMLRTPYSSWNKRLFADQLVQHIVSGMNLEVANSTPVSLYINGEYWGIMDMAERMDEYYFESHFKIYKDSINYSDATHSTAFGVTADFEDVYDFAFSNDLSLNENYQRISKEIDIDNLIDYIVVETYLGNRDWPGNNNERWRNGTNGKWRWVIVDMDAILWDKNYRVLEKILDTTKMNHPNRFKSTLVFRKLIENKEFKIKLIKRYEELMSTVLCPDRLIEIIEKYESIYKRDIQRQIDRWHLPPSLEVHEQNNERMKDFIRERSKYMVQDIEEQLGVKINPICE